MKFTKRCSECGGTNIRTAVVSAGGAYAPDLLPGAHHWWTDGKLEVFICVGCGSFQYFVPAAELPNVLASEKFKAYP